MKAHTPTHGLTAKLIRLAAKPQSAKRDAAMLKLQARIRASEEHVSPRIVRVPEDVLQPVESLDDLQVPGDKSVERILVNDMLLPMIRWQLDADGRGAFNLTAIGLRVTATAWLLDPTLVRGLSERKLATLLSVSHENLARAIRKVSEQLSIGHHTTGALKCAARKAGETFTAVTRRRRDAA